MKTDLSAYRCIDGQREDIEIEDIDINKLELLYTPILQ